MRYLHEEIRDVRAPIMTDQDLLNSWFLPSQIAYEIDQADLYASCSVVSLQLARKIAPHLFSERMDIEPEQIEKILNLIKKQGFALQWGGEESIDRVEHLVRSLSFLKESKEAKEIIKRLTKPYANRRAEEIIRDTLEMAKEQQITDLDAKTAVVISLLTKVRQSLGSCFGTAPAILIQEEDPLQFLKDIEALLSMGMLRKSVQGSEYTAPMSSSWGGGELKKKISFNLSKKGDSISLSPLLYTSLNEMGLIFDQDQIIQAILRQIAVTEEAITIELSYDEIIEMIFQVLVPKETQKKGGASDAKRRLKMKGECALLKSWEFTIASYAEVKFDLCRWNFYASLGINWNDEGGIGQILYNHAQQTVDETNREIEKIREKFDAMNAEIIFLEQRSRQAASEQDLAWMTMEYRSRKAEQHHLQELVDMMSTKTKKIAGLHQFLIDKYDALLKEYFQEVYDPDLHDVDVGPYDDSPAGFRLIYKHGRRNPSLWSSISSLDEYIDALCSFFSLTEQDLAFDPYIKDIESEFRLIITHLITHIRSPYFQETALNRTQVAHGLAPIKNILDNFHRLEKKPWVFTSGGSMDSLVSSYFKLEKPLEVVSRWVENETELFSFFIDTARLSYNRQKKGAFFPKLGDELNGSLLMHSPTHAFRLLPFKSIFYEGWTSETYSYSWIYNRVRDPAHEILKSTLITPEVLQRAILDIVALFPMVVHKRAKELFVLEIAPFCRIFDFANAVKEACRKDLELRKYGENLFQSGLFEQKIYANFPYQSDQIALTIIEEGLQSVPKEMGLMVSKERILDAIAAVRRKMALPVFSSFEMRHLFISALSHLFERGVEQSEGMLKMAISFLRSKQALFPEPVIIADSNWVKDYFAFLVSPVTCQIEFWAVSFLGTEGRPIPHWKRWFNGSDRSKTWGIYIDRSQYKI